MRTFLRSSLVFVLGLAGMAHADVRGYWRFEEGVGSTALDSSYHGNTAIITASGLYSPDVPTSPYPNNFSLHLNGVGQFAIAENTPSLRPTDAITLEAFVKLDRNISANAAIISMQSAGNGDSYQLGLRGHDNYPFFGFSADGTATVDLTTPIQVGRWYHLAGTWDGELIRLYVDGVLQGSRPYSAGITYPEPNPLLIGVDVEADKNLHWFFPGFIDEVRITDAALPPTRFLNVVPEVPAVLLLGLVGSLSVVFVAARRWMRKNSRSPV